ncbi:class I SAM-dependent methyltransferase [Anaerosoma tenue]|uniref:class I SAM-dependent methyltransferase n=1 Tax=Anaerosoma tenue TaxID=2933588 RepID=UPI00226084F7|nr:class I SAM-dependent methyltransferase [Anaerosoma tenue]MCK8115551.1 class I SAM-dependent methyltransferase [Anaerosoma tenue]
MAHYKFDIAKLEKLNDPARFESLPPDLFFAALDVPDGASVIVEIGAGTGLFAEAIAKRAPEATVYVADIAEEAIEWMREHRAGVAEGRIVPVLAGETHVPLDDAIADALFMINIHHEFVDTAASYREALRLLKPGGRLLVVDWAARETPKGPPQAVRATPSGLAECLKGAGFVDVMVDDSALPWHTMATARRSGE